MPSAFVSPVRCCFAAPCDLKVCSFLPTLLIYCSYSDISLSTTRYKTLLYLSSPTLSVHKAINHDDNMTQLYSMVQRSIVVLASCTWRVVSLIMLLQSLSVQERHVPPHGKHQTYEYTPRDGRAHARSHISTLSSTAIVCKQHTCTCMYKYATHGVTVRSHTARRRCR